MPHATVEILYRSAHVLVGAGALAVAALIVVELTRRPTGRREPPGVALGALFLALGVQAAVRFAYEQDVPGGGVGALAVAEWTVAGAVLAFLAFRHRYPIFIESAEAVRAWETGYAEKAREARSLAQVNEELRRLDELKSEILAMVSHELRTPLTAIIGYSRLLIRQVHGPLTPRQIEHQEAIFRSAQRLSELINDLLDVARLEAGRVELAPRPTDVHQVVEHVLAVVRPAAQAKRIRTEGDLRGLPPVQADPARLHQILVNLTGNAVKFTPPGGAVRVTGARRGDQVWIAVEDTGVGIRRDELARIWDPFYQVESPMRRRHGGSGLGLAIVRRLVELHGGLVRAESGGENRGSRFSFTLPVAREAPAGPGADDAGAPAAAGTLAGREVLIVEDDEHNQALMRAVVEDVLEGHARICPDGEQALAAAAGGRPAVVLLDLMLPDVSGWEVARRLRQDPRTRHVPVIAVSALARPQERDAAYHAGCDAYLAKPFTPDDLARVITATVTGEGAVSR